MECFMQHTEMVLDSSLMTTATMLNVVNSLDRYLSLTIKTLSFVANHLIQIQNVGVFRAQDLNTLAGLIVNNLFIV